MRKIEFRVWLKDEKRMLNDITSIRLDTKCIYYDNNQMFSYERKEFDEIELMQYTGLKDKNGVKIFEGDILKSLGYPAIEVIYDKESCSFKMKVRYKEWEDLLILSSNKTPHLEVIGNIYENPELLEVEENG